MVQHEVATHFPMVQKMARRLARRLPASVDIDDLISAGSVGLVEASRRFDPARGVSFGAFAAVRVRGAMLDLLRADAPTSRGARRRERAMCRSQDALTTRLGRLPEAEELAEETGLDPATVSAEAAMRVVSLEDLGLCDRRAAEVEAALTDPAASAVDHLAAEEARRAVTEALEILGERERLVLSLYYVEELKLREIGEILGVTESRICQIRGQALRALKARLAAD